MIFRSIRLIGTLLLLVGIFLVGNAAGKEFAPAGIDRIPSVQPSDQEILPLRVSRRPRLARIPNFNIYYAPDLHYNLYMTGRHWYLLHDDKWYQGQTHEGPWRYLSYSDVPESLKKIPADYIKKENAPLPLKKKPKHSKKKTHRKKKTDKPAKKRV